MIPGDIDLTEKLDFRKVVKKEIPKLPEKWDKNNLNISLDSSISVETNYINIGNSTYTYSLPTDSIVNINYDILNTWFDYDNYTISLSDNTYSTISFNVQNNNITSSTCTYLGNSFTWEKQEDYTYDVFGNKINSYSDILKIPWDDGIHFSNCKSIAWDNYGNRNNIFHEEDIPWDFYDDLDNEYNLSDRFMKAKKLINWLSDKSISFISNYFNTDEEKDLSYLTNMSWIRVKDAVID